jgi:membrane fusion protein (multidrug efflux system)
MTNVEIRKNDEDRMTKRPTRPPGACRHSDFVFLSSFVIRHWPLAISGSLVALALAVSCSRPPVAGAKQETVDAVPITVAKVEVMPMDRSLDVWGTLYAKDEATLGAEVEGKVEKTLVDFGDRVTAGQELASIDTTTYDALAHQAEANLAKAKASANNAELNLKRAEELRKNNIASQSDMDAAVAAAEQARAEVKADEAASVVSQLNLQRSHAKAPFDAAIADRIASAGDYLKVGAPLFRVVNDNVLKFIVQAPESYAGKVIKGQQVIFWVDAYGTNESFEGKVYLISPAVNTGTRAFPFGALVQNSEHRLKASSYARGKLVLARAVPTLVVPLDAVSTFAGVSKVFVVENGVARAQEVEVGRVREEQQQVFSGLKPGALVATSGLSKLHDGVRIRVKESDAAHEVRAASE